jgi:hypothetical protein
MAKHSDIFKIFKQFFMDNVLEGNEVDRYWPCGYGAIRIRLTNGTEYVFKYNGINKWSLETIDSFLEKLAEKRKAMQK